MKDKMLINGKYINCLQIFAKIVIALCKTIKRIDENCL